MGSEMCIRDRDQLERSGILVGRVPTELNASDLGSKALAQQTHWRLSYVLMTTGKDVYTEVKWEQTAAQGAWLPIGPILGSPWESDRSSFPQ